MIVRLVVCPGAPWLVPGVAPVLAAEQHELAARARAAAQALSTGPVVVLAAHQAPENVVVQPGEPAGPSPFERGCTTTLPGTAWVARALLGDGPFELLSVAGLAAAAESSVSTRDVPTGLLVLTEGARAHGAHAPKAQDGRSADFDVALGRVLADGDPAALSDWAAANTDLGPQLGSSAPHLLGAIAPLLPQTQAQGDYYFGAHPYGVGYHVASWTWNPSSNHTGP